MTAEIHERRHKTPRAKETYRFDRRNHSDLNRDTKDWYGVETKPGPEYPPLVKRTSKRGETHYVELWPRE